MIITQADIDEFVSKYNEFCNIEDVGLPSTIESDDFLEWLTNNPQVVIASGYQEFVAGVNSPLYQALLNDGELDEVSRPLFRDFHGDWIVPSAIGEIPRAKWDAFRLESLIQANSLSNQLFLDHREGKILYPSEFDERQEVIDQLNRQSCVTMPSFEEMVEIACRYLNNPLVDSTTLVSPRLWTPANQELEKNHLATSTLALIREFQQGEIDFADLHWRKFEEIVAEALRQLGMEIHVVRENPQGGRDIIARAELVPGSEVVTIAVEVKHRSVVDRPIIQQAIRQNQHFPALMLVTSGRFTAGVVREVARPENRMRVILKNGIAIRDMVRSLRLT